MTSAHRHRSQIPILPGIPVFSETAGTDRSASLDEGIEMHTDPLEDDCVVTENQLRAVVQQAIGTSRSQASNTLQGLKMPPKSNQSEIAISPKVKVGRTTV
jgi:hypothetical protein